MSKLFVVLPCYNEEENISEIVFEWQNQREKLMKSGLTDFEIIAVNDGSKDNTSVLLEEGKAKYTNITILTHEINKGLGQAVKTGMEYVVENGREEDYMCIMDSDNTQNPIYIFDMLKTAVSSDSDCVIASRYRKNSKITGVSAFRNFLSLGARFYYAFILGIPGVRDYTCGYRLYNVSIIKRAFQLFNDNFVSESGFSCMVEILYKIHLSGGKVTEVPFQLRYDLKKGASKMKVFKNIIKSLKLPFMLRQVKKEDKGNKETDINA
jgi:dolichol-phosphate mannosyltransferase